MPACSLPSGASKHPAPAGESELPFRLAARPAHHVRNSSCNVTATNRGHPHNPAFLAPGDAAALGIAAQDLVEFYNRNGAIIAVAELDPGLRRGNEVESIIPEATDGGRRDAGPPVALPRAGAGM
jgi:anaerobic selenocysteine-containing dehydrogenase